MSISRRILNELVKGPSLPDLIRDAYHQAAEECHTGNVLNNKAWQAMNKKSDARALEILKSKGVSFVFAQAALRLDKLNPGDVVLDPESHPIDADTDAITISKDGVTFNNPRSLTYKNWFDFKDLLAEFGDGDGVPTIFRKQSSTSIGTPTSKIKTRFDNVEL